MRAPRSIKLMEIITDYCNVMQIKNKKVPDRYTTACHTITHLPTRYQVLPSIISMETAVRYMLSRRQGIPFVETNFPENSNISGSYAHMNTPGIPLLTHSW